MRSTFLPFSTPTIEDAEINEVVDSLRSGWITTGPKVKRFEEAFKAYVGAPYAIPLSSATAGLHLTLLALGIKEGDEIITTPMTFASTVSMIILCGGTPVLVDTEPGTLNIDACLVRAKITPRTRAIIPVHFAGQACDMDPLFALAREFGLTIIEDAAHAAGTEYKGRRVGSLDSISIFSFHPNKNITTGEGGMVCTADEALAEEISLLKFHGMSREAWKRFAASGTPNYDILMPGFKYNMMDLQAAIGIHQLPRLDGFIDRRRDIAEYYNRELAGVEELALPRYAPYVHRHAWHLYTPLVRIHGGSEEVQYRQRPALQGHPPPRLVPRAPAGRRSGTAQCQLRIGADTVPAAFPTDDRRRCPGRGRGGQGCYRNPQEIGRPYDDSRPSKTPPSES
jgi:dTDP-4-amino-4,6-dideoxygalactose transaminase